MRPVFPLILPLMLLACDADPLGPWEPAPPVPDATVVFETSLGDFTVLLDGTNAPRSTTNFLSYVDAKHYDGTVFHRVIETFMIQGGGFDEALSQRSTRAPIVNESRNGLLNERGTIALARTSDPHSATSQFFINVVDNPGLDFPQPDGAGYAVFGRVTSGLEVIDAIKSVPTGSRHGMRDVPNELVVIRSVRRVP